MTRVLFVALTNVKQGGYGGAVRGAGLISGLEKLGVSVDFFYLWEGGQDTANSFANPLSTLLQRLTRLIHYTYFRSQLNFAKLVKIWRMLRSGKIDFLFFWNVNGFLPVALLARCSGVPVILDRFDAGPELLKSSYTHRSAFFKRLILWQERVALRVSDRVVVVSENDFRILSNYHKVPISKFSIVYNAVDEEQFYFLSLEERKKRRPTSLRHRFVIVFHGKLDHPPNQEAVAFIVNYLAPKLKSRIPEVLFYIIGMNPPQINHDSDTVVLTGKVGNVHDYLAIADIAVVPLMSGSGTRLKILEYLATGVPVVSTKKGAEGLLVENGNHLLLEDTTDSHFVDSILRLYQNPMLGEALSAHGRFLVEQRYTWLRSAQQLLKLYNELL